MITTINEFRKYLNEDMHIDHQGQLHDSIDINKFREMDKNSQLQYLEFYLKDKFKIQDKVYGVFSDTKDGERYIVIDDHLEGTDMNKIANLLDNNFGLQTTVTKYDEFQAIKFK